jgi:hypothetical protein
MPKRMFAGVVLTAVLVTVAACSSSTPQSAPSPSQPALSATPSATPTPTPTPTPNPALTPLETTSDPHATPWTDQNADFGWVRSATVVSGGVDISFDRATWLLSDQITAWNKANPGHQVVGADDYAIGNVSTKLRTFLVKKNAVIFGSVALTGDEAPSRMTAAKFAAAMKTNPGGVTVWLYHQYGGLTGDVVQLEEQFRP